MENIEVNTALVAKCGLYCGACGAYLKKKCPGCSLNTKAAWCKLRKCCIDSGISTCAECRKTDSTRNCKIFDNFISRLFALIFRSDRHACIEQIKKYGLEQHARLMADLRSQTIKRS